MTAIERALAEEEGTARRSPDRLRFWDEAMDIFGVPELDEDGEAATARQCEALERAGLHPPANLSRTAASELIEAVIERRERGLCTPRQLRFLARHGIDAREMSFEEASQRIQRRMSRWRRVGSTR